MDAPSPAAALSAAVAQWTKFLTRALVDRLETDTFEAYVPLLNSKHPLPPVLIAGLLLRPTPGNHDFLDPRVFQYLQVLLKLNLVDTTSVLKALYTYSTSQARIRRESDAAAADSSKPKLLWGNSYSTEEVIFYRLTKAVAQGTGIRAAKDSIQVVRVMAKWMALFTMVSASFAADAMGEIYPSQLKVEMESARAAFVMLLLGVCENQTVLATLSRPAAKGARKELSENLANFISTIAHNSSEIAQRLENFRSHTLASFEPVDKKKEAEDAQMLDVYDQTLGLERFPVQELPIQNSRAGLYIYLNASLVGRPLLDDIAVFTYLNSRYGGDLQSTAIDLILASFDVLANAVFRNNEGAKSGLLLRSFLINKVPLLLASLSSSPYALNSSFPQYNSGFCITQALNRVDTSVFPTMSNMFDVSNNHNAFTETVRQEFCFACLLHGLISKEATDELLGEITFQDLPAGGRYVKDNLVQQCLADPERLQKLIVELEGMDGNAGAACQALAEVMGQLCRNKETMALKQLCSQLARKPLYLDVMLLFNKAETILQPLCELLDNWRYDDDQGEYQPVYEEFGSILLLVLAFAYRYGLSPADLKISSADSFVAKLLTQGQLARPLEELSEQESAHIGGWVSGLFDSEAGGLGDELMSSCPPQDFYLLIPTLFQQIVLAFSVGRLTEEMLKGGLEYLVDTFLLPSLVPAILYLCNHIWADRTQDQKAIIRIFQLVLLPKSISNEASTMLSSVLNIVAQPLEHALRSYQRQDPKSQDVEPLLRALKANIPLSRRTGNADPIEFESWTSTNGGGLAAAIRHTIQGLIQWSQSSVLNGMPSPYTHRQVIMALKLLGAKRLLATILDELRQQTDSGNGSVAYDVATALVCAPDPTNDPNPLQPPPMPALDESGNVPALRQRRTTLRQALKREAEEWKKIQKSDPVMAETAVRLYRRVEAQMVVPQEPMLQPVELTLDDDAFAAAAAAAAATDGDDALQLDTSVDLGLGADGGLGLGSATLSGGGGGMGGLDDQDIFGDLTGGSDFNLDNLDSWSDMNLA